MPYNDRPERGRTVKLAVFTNQFPGRISTFFARDMLGLIKAGIDVDIFAFYPLEPELWRYVPHSLNETLLSRQKVHHISVGKSVRSGNLRNGKLRRCIQDMVSINMSAARFGLSSLLKTNYVALKGLAWARIEPGRYDHVLAYWGNYAATCAYIFHRLSDRPIPFSMILHAGMDLYETPIYMREKLLYADNILVVCDFNREFIRKEFSDIFAQIAHKIHKHHLGLDLTEYQYTPDRESATTIMAVGALETYKGFDYLLRAGDLLCRRGLEYDITIIGEGKESASLRKLAVELGIGERVTFLGWLSPDEVRMAMSKATILVHPSNGLGDAVPTVIKESMALGTPVVASDIAGIPELLDDGRCGVLVPTRNAKSLADAIQRLLMDPELRLSYAKAARHYAEIQFDLWENGRRLARVLSATKRCTNRT